MKCSGPLAAGLRCTWRCATVTRVPMPRSSPGSPDRAVDPLRWYGLVVGFVEAGRGTGRVSAPGTDCQLSRSATTSAFEARRHGGG